MVWFVGFYTDYGRVKGGEGGIVGCVGELRKQKDYESTYFYSWSNGWIKRCSLGED